MTKGCSLISSIAVRAPRVRCKPRRRAPGKRSVEPGGIAAKRADIVHQTSTGFVSTQPAVMIEIS